MSHGARGRPELPDTEPRPGTGPQGKQAVDAQPIVLPGPCLGQLSHSRDAYAESNQDSNANHYNC